MQLARVIGDIVASHKDENLSSLKLLVLQPLAADGSDAGRTLVAVDAAGAGVGETVFFVRGKEASFPFHPTEVPTDDGADDAGKLHGMAGLSRCASGPRCRRRRHRGPLAHRLRPAIPCSLPASSAPSLPP